MKENLQKITELRPECQYSAALWLHDMENRGLKVKVTEVYRSQERQNELFKIGRRGRSGEKPVTWTKNSQHIQRLACDVIALNCSYEKIADFGRVYGIFRPKELVMLGDYGHFDFSKCIKEPKPPTYTPSAIARGLTRRIADAIDPLKTRLKNRLISFLS